MTSHDLCHNQFVLDYQILLTSTELFLGLPDEIALGVLLEEVVLHPVVIKISLRYYFGRTLHKNFKWFEKPHWNTTSFTFLYQVLKAWLPNLWGCSIGGVSSIQTSNLSRRLTIPLVTSLSGHWTDNDFPFTASLSAKMKPKYSCVEETLTAQWSFTCHCNYNWKNNLYTLSYA